MNLLTLEIKEELETSDFWLNLKIDGIEFLKAIDEELNAVFFEELLNSTTGNGKYLIFTCSCGVADCGGWDKIDVTHSNSSISWTFNYDDVDYNFEFNKMYYEGEIKRFKFELEQSQISLEPKHILEPK